MRAGDAVCLGDLLEREDAVDHHAEDTLFREAREARSLVRVPTR